MNFYIHRKIKNILVEICELFHGNTNSKKKLFKRMILKYSSAFEYQLGRTIAADGRVFFALILY